MQAQLGVLVSEVIELTEVKALLQVVVCSAVAAAGGNRNAGSVLPAGTAGSSSPLHALHIHVAVRSVLQRT